jgi:branched-chain amino acid transport system ATP-binding protein
VAAVAGGKGDRGVKDERRQTLPRDPAIPLSYSKGGPAEPPRPNSELRVEHVTRRFGGLTAVCDFSLAVRTGELVGLIGPNGAGKTTAFNVITGVYPPSEGLIFLDGRRIDGHSVQSINRAGIARTFQNIRLFGSLTVLDNVTVGFTRSGELGLPTTVMRLPRFYREHEHATGEGMALLETLNLADKADFQARNLPYGDQRRLEIARALATRPKILLLDEPAAGMNPQEKLVLMDLIRSIRDRFQLGVLLIEHDMKLVMTICERITVLDHGETIAVGRPEEVRANPDVIEAYLGEAV